MKKFPMAPIVWIYIFSFGCLALSIFFQRGHSQDSLYGYLVYSQTGILALMVATALASQDRQVPGAPESSRWCAARRKANRSERRRA